MGVLVKRERDDPKPEFAESLERGEANQLFLLSPGGNVISPSKLAAKSFLPALLVAQVPFLIAFIAFGLGAPFWLIDLWFVAFLAMLVWNVRDGRRVNRLASLVANDRLDDAADTLRALAGSLWFPGYRAYVDHHAALVAWRRGDHEAALASANRAIEESSRRPWMRWGPVYWLARFDRAQLLAIGGQPEAARAALELAEDAPPGDYFRLERNFADLVLAFHDPSSPAMSGDLHPFVRMALRSNITGGHLVALAWAHDRLGDRDLAEHLLLESQSRLRNWHLDRTYPALHEWMRVRLVQTRALA